MRLMPLDERMHAISQKSSDFRFDDKSSVSLTLTYLCTKTLISLPARTISCLACSWVSWSVLTSLIVRMASPAFRPHCSDTLLGCTCTRRPSREFRGLECEADRKIGWGQADNEIERSRYTDMDKPTSRQEILSSKSYFCVQTNESTWCVSYPLTVSFDNARVTVSALSLVSPLTLPSALLPDNYNNKTHTHAVTHSLPLYISYAPHCSTTDERLEGGGTGRRERETQTDRQTDTQTHRCLDREHS